MTHNESNRFTVLRLKDVMNRTGLSRSHIYHLVSKSQFPSQIKLGGIRASGWIESEVQQWIQDRINASRGTQTGAA
jgi:prophage regulatory protein